MGRIVLEDVEFQRTYVRVVRQMGQLGVEAGKAAGGTSSLDEGFAAVSASATRATASLGRATKATVDNSAADTKAAASAQRLAAATTEVGTVMARYASASDKTQAAALRQLAANQRLAASSAEVGSADRAQAAETAKLASAQAGALAASTRLAATQTSLSAKAVTAGKNISKYLTLPLAVAAGYSIKSAMDFQQATNVYVTAAGESAKNLGVVRDGIKNVAVETGTSIKNLTDAEYLIEKAGIRGANGLQVLAAAAKGAREENAPLADVVQAMTSIMASYHLQASQSVQVMNALKTGAGQAKVTMDEYAKSLSTVIPIASANKISIEQVLGAISTLTQHGTSAQEATQELGATIRNLAAPNQVAIKAMQQLGLNVNDVTKNIGQRGLTGTIDLLVGAITDKMGKSGLVIVNAMKQSQSATADLNAMLTKMPSNLATLSKGFLDGKVSMSDYRTGIRGMGADGYAMGSQFLALVPKAKGFNELLKAGSPAAQTFTKALRDVSGGAIGLNTILQLSGGNMAGFKDRTDAVAASLNNSSKDVEGWASTAKLASTQAGIAKESLHVLAIDAGTNLLPIFNHIVSGLTDAVTWFGNLSHTDKEVLGWSVGVLAALGPILSIGGRLAGAARSLATFAGTSEETASRVALSTQRIAGALAGIGLVYGSTQTGGIAGHIMGALGGGMTGAAIGSFFGPLGTAIGGVAGALGGLGLSYLHSGDAAKKSSQVAQAAMASQKSAADQLEQSLEGVATAYNSAYKQQLAQSLTKTNIGGANYNVLGIAKTAGINPQDIISQVIGTGTAKQLDAITKALMNAQLAGKISEPEWDAVSTALGLVGGSAAKAERNIELQNEALGKGVLPANQLGVSYKKLSAALQGTGTSLDARTAAGERNIAVVQQEAGAIGTWAAKQVTAHKNVNDVAAAVGNQSIELQNNLRKLGLNTDQVQALIVKYAHVPASVATKLATNAPLVSTLVQELIGKYSKVPPSKSTAVSMKDHASGPLSYILQLENALHDKSIYITTFTETRGFSVKGSAGAKTSGGATGGTAGDIARGFAAGGSPGDGPSGTVVGPGSDTSDSVVIRVSPDEEIIRASQARKYRTLLKAINAGVQGFASGGSAAATVAATVASGVKPDPSASTGYLQYALGYDTKAATREQQQALAAYAAYQKLEKELARVEAEDKRAAAAAKGHTGELQTQAKSLAALASKLKTEASTAKASYDKMGQAAKDAASKAADAAKALVASVQSQLDSLKTSVSDFVSSMTSSIAGDYSLSTLWGNVTSNAQSAADALKAAQDAVNQATPDTAALAAAQAAQATATDKLAAAHKALADAQAAVAAGKGTPAQYAALTKAQQAQTDAVTQLATANSALQSAQQAVANTAGPTADQLQALADAQNAYNAALAANSVAGLQNNLDQILASTKTFAGDLNSLVGEGADQDLVSQIAGMGTTAGDALAQQLLAAGPGAIKALQTTMASIANVAGAEGDQLGADFFGKGVSALDQLVAGMQKQFPALKTALAPIINALNQMFTFTPQVVTGAGSSSTVSHILEQSHTLGWLATNYHETIAQLQAANPSLKADTSSTVIKAGTTLNVPAFAAGVTDFAGGLAYVHRDELLVNLPARTDVIPRSKTPGQAGLDAAVVSELRGLRADVNALAAEIGHEVAVSGVDLYARAGREQAVAMRRATRKGAF